jgi:hypothetical protein
MATGIVCSPRRAEFELILRVDTRASIERCPTPEDLMGSDGLWLWSVVGTTHTIPST